eukprot:CAMPEP_0170627422 /NCGR_PEP_ID=MMETSP0224-20130122/31965_1 /TAXON_ID=285029 /ORGANISM="Togula jolla, Strain CCCM 725" /LENGTH=323 /DNA_ID=CAMNT_0010954425 /DNA_START=130 /DNA_END=1101 /DNA_ORIENTATION=-
MRSVSVIPSLAKLLSWAWSPAMRSTVLELIGCHTSPAGSSMGVSRQAAMYSGTPAVQLLLVGAKWHPAAGHGEHIFICLCVGRPSYGDVLPSSGLVGKLRHGEVGRPHPDRLVATGRSQAKARAQGQSADETGVAPHHFATGSGAIETPDPHGEVCGAGGKLTVWERQDRTHHARVARQDLDAGAILCPPYPDRRVVSTGGEAIIREHSWPCTMSLCPSRLKRQVALRSLKAQIAMVSSPEPEASSSLGSVAKAMTGPAPMCLEDGLAETAVQRPDPYGLVVGARSKPVVGQQRQSPDEATVTLELEPAGDTTETPDHYSPVS